MNLVLARRDGSTEEALGTAERAYQEVVVAITRHCDGQTATATGTAMTIRAVKYAKARVKSRGDCKCKCKVGAGSSVGAKKSWRKNYAPARRRRDDAALRFMDYGLRFLLQ